ncbi:MAG: hypothetical protein HY288_20475 [Planctomycetia bacterium]|nr:hypothetical protein [Planctomycetia bacterium]
MKTTVACAAFFIVVATANAALAQVCPYVHSWQGPFYSSTPYEGALHGEADYIRSYGQFLESQALAAQTWGSVDRINQTNRYLKLSAIREALERERTDRYRRLAEAARRNQSLFPKAAPNRLTPQDLSDNGTIAWPVVLLDSRYETTRTRLDGLFKQRAQWAYCTANPQMRQEIEAAACDLKEELRRQIGQLRSSDYLQAKRFVQALADEARLPAGQTQVAENR